MKWFNTIYVVATVCMSFPFFVAGWIAAEIRMAFRAGFELCSAYNIRAVRDATKVIDELLGD